MYKQCKTERSIARQRTISESLLLMMKHRRFDDITVTDICAELDMPRKAFYRYFDDKESALDCAIAQTLARYPVSRSSIQSPRLLHRELQEFFEFWLYNKELIEVLDKNGRITKIIDLSLRFPIETIVSVNKLLPDEEEGMREKIYRFAISGLISLVIDWYHEGFKSPAADIARVAVRILTKAPFPSLAQFGMVDVT